MSIWIVIGLVSAIVVNAGLALLVMSAPRRSSAHYWFSAMLLGLAIWVLGIMQFLVTKTDMPFALEWVRVYYIAAALFAFSLFEFGLWFPRRIRLHPFWQILVMFSFASVCFLALSHQGIIKSVTLNSSAENTATLRQGWYWVYVAYFMTLAISSLANWVAGARYARIKHRTHLRGQLQTLIVSAVIALGIGCWFNLIIPLFGNYSMIWVGPIATFLFIGASIYAVARQGLFDLRQALMRSVAYLLLFGTLILLYSILLQVLSQLLAGVVISNFWGITTTRAVLVLVLTVTILPLKRFFDTATRRVFYRDSYDMGQILESLRQVVRTEVKLQPLTTRSLRLLEHAFLPRFTVAYIIEANGDIISYTGSERAISTRQSAAHRLLVEKYLDELPQVGHVHDIDHLRRTPVSQLLVDGHVGAFMRLEAQRQSVGMVFFGRKTAGRLYDGEDLRLLDISSSELGLAIQNSLRYREIEQFTLTLEDRIKTATKELRSSNLKLQQLDEAKDEFISMASHQLRTPLTSIKGYIDMVLEGDAGPINEVQKKFLVEAFSSSERMVHIINDFLNVSRLQTGKFMIETTPVDLSTVVGQEVDSLKTTAKSRGLKLDYHVPATLPLLNLDEGKMRQVIMNFIDNAIYYSREGTTVEIVLSSGEGSITFEVHDTGIGVPPKEQKQLFGKFFRASNARKHRPDGTGVGLFLAKKVVVAHGGTVIFRSPSRGGSIFGFRLPVAKLRVASEQADNTENDQK